MTSDLTKFDLATQPQSIVIAAHHNSYQYPIYIALYYTKTIASQSLMGKPHWNVTSVDLFMELVTWWSVRGRCVTSRDGCQRYVNLCYDTSSRDSTLRPVNQSINRC